MPNKPIIAITVESQRDAENARTGGKFELNWNYAQMVAEAGGLPLVVPPVADMDEIAALADGWLIPGGADLDSAIWGEPLHPKAELQDGTRFEAEKRLFEALDPRVPVLGICYGCQVLNVLRGGSLEQHLPDIVGNESHSGGTMQEYAVEEDSLLARSAGTTSMQGQSYHHQAVGKVAEGMRVVAQTPDGTVEALEATDRPWTIGVQWHPERTPDDIATRRLFERFVAVADAYRMSKL
ncbi:gamma-glutamyl-gamma-aminobutyrate hydrolase family protein [bacterium]|nr:MAG: gamma-glutamyl-gamma-aminobutyrate hydrolase family protein [bacterium]